MKRAGQRAMWKFSGTLQTSPKVSLPFISIGGGVWLLFGLSTKTSAKVILKHQSQTYKSYKSQYGHSDNSEIKEYLPAYSGHLVLLDLSRTESI